MRSLYMTGPPAGAQHSLALVQSGLADAASASCPGGDHSFHAYSHTHTHSSHTVVLIAIVFSFLTGYFVALCVVNHIFIWLAIDGVEVVALILILDFLYSA